MPLRTLCKTCFRFSYPPICRVTRLASLRVLDNQKQKGLYGRDINKTRSANSTEDICPGSQPMQSVLSALEIQPERKANIRQRKCQNKKNALLTSCHFKATVTYTTSYINIADLSRVTSFATRSCLQRRKKIRFPSRWTIQVTKKKRTTLGS